MWIKYNLFQKIINKVHMTLTWLFGPIVRTIVRTSSDIVWRFTSVKLDKAFKVKVSKSSRLYTYRVVFQNYCSSHRNASYMESISAFICSVSLVGRLTVVIGSETSLLALLSFWRSVAVGWFLWQHQVSLPMLLSEQFFHYISHHFLFFRFFPIKYSRFRYLHIYSVFVLLM